MWTAFRRRAWAVWGLVAPFAALLCVGQAQERSRSATARPPPSYRLRCTPDRRSLCRDVERAMRIRGAVPVRVGDPVGAYRPEERDVVLGAPDGPGRAIEVVLVAREGTELRTVVELPEDDEAATRAVVLAVEALADLDAAPPAPRTAGGSPPASRVWERVLLPDVPRGIGVRSYYDRRPRRAFARPVIFGRLLGGVSLERGELLFGPGLGFGLCVVGQCAVIEADLSLVPVEVAQDGLVVRYTAVTFSMRVLLRPLVLGPLSFAITAGAVARLGSATTSEDVTRTVTDAGFRGTLEIAYRIAGPVEAVLELGVDGLVQRARFVRAERSILLEDAVTPWIVLGGRVRP